MNNYGDKRISTAFDSLLYPTDNGNSLRIAVYKVTTYHYGTNNPIDNIQPYYYPIVYKNGGAYSLKTNNCEYPDMITALQEGLIEFTKYIDGLKKEFGNLVDIVNNQIDSGVIQ